MHEDEGVVGVEHILGEAVVTLADRLLEVGVARLQLRGAVRHDRTVGRG